MAQKKYMRNPNGYGTVFKLSGNRRNPWVAKKFDHWTYDEESRKDKVVYSVIGYYPDRISANEALVLYNKDPYDIKGNCLTFADVYESWSDEHFKNIVPSATRTWKSAYQHSLPLHGIAMVDIKVSHLESTILNASVGDNTKSRMKSLFNMMYRYAMKHEIVSKNYAELCNSVKIESEKRKIVPFTNEEVSLLWKNINIPFADMVLIGMYSGWRPQELAILKTSDVDLEESTMTGGLKTDAGRNRIVPIHTAIIDLVKKRYNKDNQFLFNDEEGQQGTIMTYDKYRGRFNKVMTRLNLKHHPHETRHTFISSAKKNGVDEYVLKLVVGHEISDVTEKIYTHRGLEQLKNEINKVQY